NFASVKATDDTTLVIKTKKPQANVPYVSIPESGIPIVPKHVWTEHVENLNSYQNDDFPIVGYGPWELVEHETEQFVRLEANEDFKLGDHGPPAFDELILNSFKNTDAAVAALRSGQIDYVDGLNPTQFESLQSDDGIKAYQAYGDGWSGVAINDGAETRSGESIGTANPILADDKVRLAIHHAIDKETLVDKVIAGHGIAGAGVMPPSYDQWFWQPDDSSLIEFDPDKANAILDEAGYERGDDGIRVDPKSGEKLQFRLGTHSDEPSDAQIAQYLQGWLKDVGIAIEVEPMSFSKLNDDLAKGDWDMLMDGWHTGPDPTYQLSIQTCMALPTDAKGTAGYTDSFHCYPRYDELFNKQLTTFDVEERRKVVDEMQRLMYEHNSNIFFYYSNTLGAVRTDAATDVISGEADDDGYYPVQTAFWHYLDAKPAESSDDGSGSATGWYVAGGAVVVLAIAGGGFALRRRSTSDDRE
ncbi:MAG: ABC transporter substrate-binding protein, partial [Actinomycetia bacterium]|nr:ABC transporter substrate-binding protein [Actinomycetes bacterium]